MRLQVDESVHDVRSGSLQLARLPDIGRFVESSLQFDKRGHGFPVFRSFAKRFDDRAFVRCSIKSLLYGHHFRIARGLAQELHNHVESFVRMVKQHVLLPNGGEYVSVVILHPFRNARRELRPQEVGTFVQNKLSERARSDHSIEFEHLCLAHLQLLHDELPEISRRARRDRKVDDSSPPAPLQGGFELANEILGFFLKFQIAVAKNLERALLGDLVPRKYSADLFKQQLLQGQKPHLAFRSIPQANETVYLLRNGKQGLQRSAVIAPGQTQCERKALVRNEREGVRGIDRQRRQHGEDAVDEHLVQKGFVRLREIRPVQERDPLAFQRIFQTVQHVLLRNKEFARFDFYRFKLLRGGQTVGGGADASLSRELSKSRHSDAVEFIQIRGGYRDEPNSLKERNGRVLCFLEHAPVECEP